MECGSVTAKPKDMLREMLRRKEKAAAEAAAFLTSGQSLTGTNYSKETESVQEIFNEAGASKQIGARGGSRTHMRKNPRRILSPQRLPFRHPGRADKKK